MTSIFCHFSSNLCSIYSADNNVKITNLEINKAVDLKDRELKIKKLELLKKRNENILLICFR